MIESVSIETRTNESIDLAEQRLLENQPDRREIILGLAAILRASGRPTPEEMPEF
jgi:hypothetical protein